MSLGPYLFISFNVALHGFQEVYTLFTKIIGFQTAVISMLKDVKTSFVILPTFLLLSASQSQLF